MLPLSSDDRISSVLPLGGDESGDASDNEEAASQSPKQEHLVMLTRSGYIKKTPLSAFQKINRYGQRQGKDCCISLLCCLPTETPTSTHIRGMAV